MSNYPGECAYWKCASCKNTIPNVPAHSLLPCCPFCLEFQAGYSTEPDRRRASEIVAPVEGPGAQVRSDLQMGIVSRARLRACETATGGSSISIAPIGERKQHSGQQRWSVGDQQLQGEQRKKEAIEEEQIWLTQQLQKGKKIVGLLPVPTGDLSGIDEHSGDSGSVTSDKSAAGEHKTKTRKSVERETANQKVLNYRRLGFNL